MWRRRATSMIAWVDRPRRPRSAIACSSATICSASSGNGRRAVIRPFTSSTAASATREPTASSSNAKMMSYVPRTGRCAGLATGDPCATGPLQLERDVLHDMAHPRAFSDAARKSARHARPARVQRETRQRLEEASREPGDQVRRQSLEGADVDHQVNDGEARPPVRSMEGPFPQDLDSRFGRWQVCLLWTWDGIVRGRAETGP